MIIRDKIRNSVISVYCLFTSMPWALRLIAGFCLLGVGFTGVILPFMKFHINGEEVTYNQFWASGVGLEAFALGISLFVTGIGICLKRTWSRYLLVFVIISFSVLLPAVHNEMQFCKNDFVETLIILVPLILYLFFKRSVKDYFRA